MINFNKNETNENIQFNTINLRNDIKNILCLTPEEKRNKIGVLYEAVQLYQVGNFRGVLDNQKIINGNFCWNYHKPWFHAVRTNEGCCAANSIWLSYLLKDKYEQIGFIHYSQHNGNGHIMNYIYHNGWYYFIDMMMYRTDSL
jgi:hypothetical protein